VKPAPGLDPAAHGLRPPAARPEIPGGGPQSAAEVLDRVLAQDPEREALVGRHGSMSYAELDLAANRAARALAELGVGPGDRVAACLPNDVDIAVAFLGCMRMGALWVGVGRALAPPEKEFLLRDSGARVFLATPDVACAVSQARRVLPDLAHVLAVDPGGAGDEWRARLEAGRGAGRPDVEIDPFAPAAIAYTSGTTGRPKGAVHSQHNMLLPGAVSRALGRYPPGLRKGVVLPLTILNLVILGPLTAFQLGTCCVAIDRIDPLGLAGWIRRERVGAFAGVPTIFHDLLTHPGVRPEDLRSLVAPEVGGAVCPEEFRRLYRERFGAEVRVGYGMTEAPTAVTWSDGRPAAQPGYCGRALPQVEIAILGEKGERLPPGEVGEICVGPSREGPWAGVYTPMLGYWRRPEATAEALRDGLYHSGDLGLLEPDGALVIRGRRSELILRGGANVYPAEVERAIEAIPGVAGCAVLGVPDLRLGQRVVAAIEPAPGAALSADAIRAELASQLARYKVPERIEIVAKLPRNAMAKVIKRELEPLFRS
jgi:acyl-CoA synthetase (AMP-forming)/AMP-acid ligase II